jgi:hypothetical protein
MAMGAAPAGRFRNDVDKAAEILVIRRAAAGADAGSGPA